MILERERINGQMASVAYLMSDFSPAQSKEKAEMVKILFDDGNMLIGTRPDVIEEKPE